MLHLLVIQLLLKVLLGHKQACLTLLKAITVFIPAPFTPTSSNNITAALITSTQIFVIAIILLLVICLYRGKCR